MPGFPYGGGPTPIGPGAEGNAFLDFLRRMMPTGSGAAQLLGQAPVPGAGKAITDQLPATAGPTVVPKYGTPGDVPVNPRTVATAPPAVVQRPSPGTAAITGTPNTQPTPDYTQGEAFLQTPAGSMGGPQNIVAEKPVEAPRATMQDVLSTLKAPEAAEGPRISTPSAPDLYRGKSTGSLVDFLGALVGGGRGGGGEGGLGPGDLQYLSSFLKR